MDVTLAAEGRQLQAHKVVLSACSSYFQVSDGSVVVVIAITAFFYCCAVSRVAVWFRNRGLMGGKGKFVGTYLLYYKF